MKKLQKAIRKEKKGKFKSALKLYQSLVSENMPDKDLLYVRRSVAACFYYLKEYEKAINEYQTILNNIPLDSDLKNQIEENMHLCFIYGGVPEKGIKYFKERINHDEKISKNRCWWYWYIAQGYQQLSNFKEAEISYKKAYEVSKEINADKESFFFLYLAVISLFRKNTEEAEKVLFEYKNLYNENDNNGLFYILYGIVSMRKNYKTGIKFYKKGIKKAKKDQWQENVILADELLKVNIS